MTFASTKARERRIHRRRFDRGRDAQVGLVGQRAGQGRARAAILASLAGKPAPAPALNNICYSLVTPDHGISVTDVYQVTEGQGHHHDAQCRGDSSARTPTDLGERKLEAAYARGWYRNISADSWG